MRNYKRIAKLILMFCIAVCLPNIANAQLANEYSNWLIYNNMKVKFDLQKDTVTSQKVEFNFPESFSNISDSLGNLILASTYNTISAFKSDTLLNVYSTENFANHLQINNNNLILKLIGFQSRYIVFRTYVTDSLNDDKRWNKFDSTYFEYDIIDYTGVGYGFYIGYRFRKLRNNVSDLVTAHYNSIDSSYTLVIMNYLKDSIISYKCDAYGNTKYLNSKKLDTMFSNLNSTYKATLKISPNGKYIATCGINEPFSNIIPFDPLSGAFGTQIRIPHYFLDNNLNVGAGSCEFSQNSKKIYFSFLYKVKDTNDVIHCGLIQQYDLSNFNEASIIGSIKELKDTTKYFMDIQKGPDDYIYINQWDALNKSYDKNRFIVKIGNTNDRIDQNSNIRTLSFDNSLFESTKLRNNLFPNIPSNTNQNRYNSQKIVVNSPVCYKDSTFINVLYYTDSSKIDCSWTGPNGFTSKAKNPKFVYNSESQNGWYYLKTVHNATAFENLDSIFIQNYRINPTKIISNRPSKICDGDTVTLTSSIVASTIQDKNIWTSKSLNTPRVMENIQVFKTAWYYLKSVDENGCTTYDSIYLEFLPRPKAEIGLIGSLSICQGDSVKLFIKDKLATVDYEWLVNNKIVNADTLIAKAPQKYKLIAKNKSLSSCTDIAEIEVLEQVNEKLIIVGTKSFCEGDSTKLEISKPFLGVQFEWNTGDKGTSITAFKTGNYWCRATNNNCLTADTIQISLYPKPIINITGDSLICKNATGVLTLNGTYTSCTWSSGDTTSSIAISKTGIYSVQAENQFGCRATAQIEVKETTNNIDMSKFQDIDFGNVQINDSSTIDIDLNGINPSNFKLKFGKDFYIVRIGNKLEIKFKARYNGLSEDSLFIEFAKPCQETIALKLSALAEGEQIITLKVSDIEVLAGDTNVLLPITYKLNDKINLPQTISWTAKLNYKSAIYYPDITRDVQSANTKIEVFLSGTTTLINKEDTLTIIKGKTYLADTIYTKVNFEDFTVNPNFTSLKEDGSIKIVGLCAPNLRGVEFITLTTIVIKPNPTSGAVDIEFNSETFGETKLRLFNASGIEVLAETKNKETKTLLFHYDNLNLPNGTYQLQILQKGKVVKSAKLMIKL